MANAENLPPKEGSYSGTQFLQELEVAWGGKLYFKIAQSYEEELGDITPWAYTSLRYVFDLNAKMERHPDTIGITGNIATDFRNHLVTSMPHPAEASDRIHILADPFCRAVLDARLNNFLKACARTPDDEKSFAIEDTLPFTTDNALRSSIFTTMLILPSLDAYFDMAKTRAGTLSRTMPDLTNEQRSRFEQEFDVAMDRFKAYVHLSQENKDGELHPMIQIMSHMLIGDYLLNK